MAQDVAHYAQAPLITRYFRPSQLSVSVSDQDVLIVSTSVVDAQRRASPGAKTDASAFQVLSEPYHVLDEISRPLIGEDWVRLGLLGYT